MDEFDKQDEVCTSSVLLNGEDQKWIDDFLAKVAAEEDTDVSVGHLHEGIKCLHSIHMNILCSYWLTPTRSWPKFHLNSPIRYSKHAH